MVRKKFEFLEHTSEVKFKAFGKNIDEVFNSTVLAVSSIISRDSKIKQSKIKKIRIKGNDLESLMYNFIDELIYFLDAENFVVSKSKVRVDEKKLKLEGEIFGDNAGNYKNLDHIKAATYSEMFIKEKSKNSWEAQVVLDV